jgi:mRNA interferase MazF
MTGFKRDISLIRFPWADLQIGKFWPVLLLSKMPGPFDDCLICGITSQLRHEVKGWDERIEKTDGDFKGSGLKVPSLIRIGKLVTVEEAVLEGVLGEISSEWLRRILTRLRDHLERVRRVTGDE